MFVVDASNGLGEKDVFDLDAGHVTRVIARLKEPEQLQEALADLTTTTAATAVWEWGDGADNRQWTEYDASLARTFEAAFVDNKTEVEFTRNGGKWRYTLSLENMQQKNLKTGYVRPVRRREIEDAVAKQQAVALAELTARLKEAQAESSSHAELARLSSESLRRAGANANEMVVQLRAEMAAMADEHAEALKEAEASYAQEIADLWSREKELSQSEREREESSRARVERMARELAAATAMAEHARAQAEEAQEEAAAKRLELERALREERLRSAELQEQVEELVSQLAAAKDVQDRGEAGTTGVRENGLLARLLRTMKEQSAQLDALEGQQRNRVVGVTARNA